MTKTLKSKPMTHNVVVYVPSVTKDGNLLSNTEVVSFVETLLSKRFGGTTSYQVKGSWVNQKGELIQEDITRVQSFTSNLSDNDIDFIESLAYSVKEDMIQEFVSIEIDNHMYLI